MLPQGVTVRQKCRPLTFDPWALSGSRRQTESWWKRESKRFQGLPTEAQAAALRPVDTLLRTLGDRDETLGSGASTGARVPAGAPMQCRTLHYINTAAEGGPAHSV